MIKMKNTLNAFFILVSKKDYADAYHRPIIGGGSIVRSVRQLQEELKKNRLSVAELTREECFALFEAWTEEYRHGRLQDVELFLACAERIRSFSQTEKPNEGARLAKPEKELRRQIAAEREKQARSTRRMLPLLATACVLVGCSAFAIGAGARAISPQANHFWDSAYDGIQAGSVCEGQVSRWDCLSVTDASCAQALEGMPSADLDSAGYPEDCSKAEASVPAALSNDGADSCSAECSTAEALVPTAENYQKDLKTVQASAEAMFGSSPKLPWSLEDELQAANGILIDGEEIILRTEDMQLQISSSLSTLGMYNSSGSMDISDLSVSDETKETSEWVMEESAAEVGEPFCYVLYRDGFCYRITVRDASAFEAVKDALAIDD